MVQVFTKKGDLGGGWDRRWGGDSDMKESPLISNVAEGYMILGEVNGAVALQWTNRELTL